MYLLAKYNVQTDFYFPMVKRAVVDLAVTGDWTPATGDTKLSKDGGAVANSTNNPAIASGVSWKLTITATELSCKWLTVQIVDSATKAVEDQFLTILTYGNASAFFIAPDYQDSAAFGLSRLDAAVTSRMATFTLPTNFSSLSIDASGRMDLAKVLGSAINALISGRVDANAGVVGDKTGYALSTAGVQAIWDALTSALTTVGSIGKRLADDIDATISSRGTGTALTATQVENAVWDATASSHNTAGTTGNKLNAAGSAGDPWTTALPGAYSSGQAGNIVGNNLNASVSSRATPAQILTTPANLLATDASGRVTVGSIVNGAIAAATFAASALDAVWSTATRTLTAGTNIALAKGTGVTGFNDLSATGVENAVWDATAASHNTAGTTGNKLNSAASAGDPLGNAVPGSYGAGTAGNVLGNLVASVWNALTATYSTPATMGHALGAAGSAADPLVNTVPGAYPVGSAGYILGNLPMGDGAISWTYTLTRSDNSAPIPGASVWVTSDVAGSTLLAGPSVTNGSGQVTFLLNAGTVYVWRQLAGYSFVNPDMEAVT